MLKTGTGLQREPGSTEQVSRLPSAPGRGEAFRYLTSLRLDDPALKWAWAFLEREKLWLAQDAWWVAEAKAGWPHDSIKAMLSFYGLLRGKRGSLLAGDDPTRRDRFAQLSASFATRLKPGDARANTAAWQEFGKDFAEHCKVSTELDWFMPSATMKALWFHRPDIVPMYDRWALAGLEKSKGHGTRRLLRSDFLDRAYALLEKESGRIDDAQVLLGSTYPYRIRVLDGLLWLEGNPASKSILERFRSGCAGLATQGKGSTDA